MRVLVLAGLILIHLGANVRISDRTVEGFSNYIKQVEPKMDDRALDLYPELRDRALKGEIVAVPFAYHTRSDSASVQIPDGLVNHWLGAVFIPGASVDKVRGVLQDYPNYSNIYAPDVSASRVIRSSANDFDVFLRLHRQVKVKALLGFSFPVEFNTEYQIHYKQLKDTLLIRSLSTRISQVKDPKKSHSEEMPPGDDDGFLWNLRSYWRVYPAPGGVIAECEAISLSRSVPGFLEKMVTYFTTNFPEDSMRSTLTATRKAVLARP
jgi:hypothetical protein